MLAEEIGIEIAHHSYAVLVQCVDKLVTHTSCWFFFYNIIFVFFQTLNTSIIFIVGFLNLYEIFINIIRAILVFNLHKFQMQLPSRNYH